MNEAISILLVLFGGFTLGTLFFGGLWFSLKKALVSKIPALWILGSFVLRMGIVLTGFYFISLGNWKRLLLCLLGFLTARYLVTYLTKSTDPTPISQNTTAQDEA